MYTQTLDGDKYTFELKVTLEDVFYLTVTATEKQGKGVSSVVTNVNGVSDVLLSELDEYDNPNYEDSEWVIDTYITAMEMVAAFVGADVKALEMACDRDREAGEWGRVIPTDVSIKDIDGDVLTVSWNNPDNTQVCLVSAEKGKDNKEVPLAFNLRQLKKVRDTLNQFINNMEER